MKKTILGTLFLLVSSHAVAGGGGNSWQPSISPINCVIGTSAGWEWRGDNACNEVIEKNYASGVQYSGHFTYDSGYMQYFNVTVAPGQVSYVENKTSQGKRKLTSGNASWVRK